MSTAPLGSSIDCGKLRTVFAQCALRVSVVPGDLFATASGTARMITERHASPQKPNPRTNQNMKTRIILPMITAAAVAALAGCTSTPTKSKPTTQTRDDDRPFVARTGNFEEHRPGSAQGAHADAHR